MVRNGTFAEQLVLFNFQNGMVRPERFELPTPCFVGKCSIQLSYGRTRRIALWDAEMTMKVSYSSIIRNYNHCRFNFAR